MLVPDQWIRSDQDCQKGAKGKRAFISPAPQAGVTRQGWQGRPVTPHPRQGGDKAGALGQRVENARSRPQRGRRPVLMARADDVSGKPCTVEPVGAGATKAPVHQSGAAGDVVDDGVVRSNVLVHQGFAGGPVSPVSSQARQRGCVP